MRNLTQPTDRKATGFQMIPSCALNAMGRGEISPGAYATLAALVSLCRDTRDDREANAGDRVPHRAPFRDDLAQMVNASPRTITLHIRILIEAGLLAVTQDPFGGPSAYTVKDPCGKCYADEPLATDCQTPSNEMQSIPCVDALDHQSDDESIEAEAEAEHRAIAENAADRVENDKGFRTSRAAYVATILANTEQRAELVAEIRKRRHAAAIEAAAADCQTCGGSGWLDPYADTLTKCLHGVPA